MRGARLPASRRASFAAASSPRSPCLGFTRIAEQFFPEVGRLGPNNSLHTFVRRNIGELLRDLNRLIETAILIDQSVFFALPAGPDTALTDRVDVGLDPCFDPSPP